MSYLSRFLSDAEQTITASVEEVRINHAQRFDIAEARLRTASKFPRCDCKGNKNTAQEWKRLAKTNIVDFIKKMFGVGVEKLTPDDKRALKLYCKPYLTDSQNELLRSLPGGRPPKDFWTRFSHSSDPRLNAKLTHSDDNELTDAEALTVLSRMYNPRARKLSDIQLTASQKRQLRGNVMLLAKLPLAVREKLGLLFVGKGSKGRVGLGITKKQALSETEQIIAKSIAGAVYDKHTQRLVFTTNARQRWRYIATRYENKLSDEFLRKYAMDLHRGVGGRKALEYDENMRAIPRKSVKKTKLKNTAVRSTGVKHAPQVPETKPAKPSIPTAKPVKLSLKTGKPQKKSGFFDDDLDLAKMGPDDFGDPRLVTRLATQQRPKTRHRDDYDESLNDPLDFTHEQIPEIPNTKITTRETLNQFINAIMKRHDRSYPLSLTPADWGYAEWLLVDSYKDSIDSRLLQLYEPKIKEALRRMNTKTGGAYASVRGMRDLAVAYIVTSRMTGDI